MNRPGLMTQLEVVELMRSSTSKTEWDANEATVRLMFNGDLPPYWTGAVSSMYWRKCRDWELGRLAANVNLDQLFERVEKGDRPGVIFAAEVNVPPGATRNQQLELAVQSLKAVRNGMQQLGVTPHQWMAALGKEAAAMFGDNQDDRRTFEQLLEEWLHAVRGDSKDRRAYYRRARGQAPD